MKNKNCIYCQIARKEKSSDVLTERDNFVAIKNPEAKMEGHTLIIPKKHFVTILDIPNTLGSELLKIIKDVASDLMDKKLGDGFNIIQNNLEVAGQVVMHAHFHIIPRKDNDGVKVLA